MESEKSEYSDEMAEALRQQEEARIQAELRRQRYEALRQQKESLDSMRASVEAELLELNSIKADMLYISDNSTDFTGRNADHFRSNLSNSCGYTLMMHLDLYIYQVECFIDAAGRESHNLWLQMLAL